MATETPARLASEDVIINSPLSYAGSAQRIMRVRRGVESGWKLTTVTVLAILLILASWLFVTGWYLVWGLWLVPYRLLRRGARKRKAEALRHRELMGTIQGAAIASSNAIVGNQLSNSNPPSALDPSIALVADIDREQAIDHLRQHMISGRLTSEEFEERIASAHAARTQADINAVRAGLPE